MNIFEMYIFANIIVGIACHVLKDIVNFLLHQLHGYYFPQPQSCGPLFSL